MQEQARFSVLGGAEPCRKLQGVSVKLRFSNKRLTQRVCFPAKRLECKQLLGLGAVLLKQGLKLRVAAQWIPERAYFQALHRDRTRSGQ